MADIVDFRSGRRIVAEGQGGARAKLLGVLTEYAAVMAQQRAALEELLANLVAQRQELPVPERHWGPIWRPERPLSGTVRDQLREGWQHGLLQAEAAEHLFLAARQLANLTRYQENDRTGKNRGVEAIAYRAWQDEVWRQFHVAPFDIAALRWKRRHLGRVGNEAVGRAIVADDAAWLERRNGGMNRYRKVSG